MEMICVTLADDLHAYIIKDKLHKKFGVKLSIVEVDRLLGSPELVWSFEGQCGRAILPVANGGAVRLDQVDLAWWRRARTSQAASAKYEDQGVADLVNQDWRSALRGAMESSFRGEWISRPEATERASLKMLQLKVAKECGFRIPKTLISNKPSEIKAFCGGDLGGVFVVKAVAGSRHLLLETSKVAYRELPDEETMSISPTIYQEYISGRIHLRINQFRSGHFPFRIESPELDWRQQLPNTISVEKIDSSLADKCYSLLEKLGIAMGVFDIKLSDDGEPVFFEVNPQGQFLFLEGITRFPLAERFAEFLFAEAKQQK